MTSLVELLHDLVFDYTVRSVALGSAILGLVSGALGCFAVLRRQSLLGDTVSHAALPGIVLAYLATGNKGSLTLLLGAALAGWTASLLVMLVVRTSRIKADAALGLVLSTFFGFGLVLLSVVQRHGGASQAGLDRFLFGQAAAMIGRDVVTMSLVGVAVLTLLLLFWKEFKLLSFDPAFGAALGFPMQRLDVLLTTLLVIAVVIGLQTVGVVLMSAMIVAPAAAARQWTDRLEVMVIVAGGFGALAGLLGAALSSVVPRLPTGPTIVLCISLITVFSLLLAPRRGLLWNWARRQRQRRRLQTEAVLADLYRLAGQHPAPEQAAHSAGVLKTMGTTAGILPALRHLRDQGLVCETGDRRWQLTLAGLATARKAVEGTMAAGNDDTWRDAP